MVICENDTRRVTRSELDGAVVPVATHFEGKRLNSPNDVVCKSDSSIYFSEPPYGGKSKERELDFQGVFVIGWARSPSAPRTTNDDRGGLSQPALPGIRLLARDFIKPNGLAFSPDETILYVADTELDHLRAFDVLPDGSITNSRVFYKVERPDGFRVDVAGNLYIAAMDAVEIFAPTGQKIIGEITLPERPANVAFGDADRQTLLICARTGLYRVRVSHPGTGMGVELG